MMRRTNRLITPVWVLAAALAAVPSLAGPPDGGTYFTILVGLEGATSITRECLDFTVDSVCTEDGDFCGAWWFTDAKGQQRALAFEVSGESGGEQQLYDGQAHFDKRGRADSLGGVGSFQGPLGRGNFAFAARRVGAAKCRKLLEDEIVDDTPPPAQKIEGSGVLASEDRRVRDFEAISVAGVGRVVAERNGLEALTLVADDNILPVLTAEVRDGRLLLGLQDGVSFNTHNEVTYRVSARELNGLYVSGAGNAFVTGLDTRQLIIDQSGAGNTTVAGRARDQQILVSGTGNYEALDLPSRTATVDISGTGLVRVRVSHRVEGVVSGTAVLEVAGTAELSVITKGLAVVRRIGDGD